MPELAEVEFFRRQWDRGIALPVDALEAHTAARVFRGCAVERWAADLRGTVLVASHAHGKQMLFEFSGGVWMAVHLGMTGELRLASGWPPAGRHDHLVVRQPGQSLIFADSRMFGRIRIERSCGQPPDWWRSLPPAVHSPEFTVAGLADRWPRHTRAPLKVLFLNQNLFPGIGNWMADEILWRLRLHPLTPAGKLFPEGIRSLHRQVQWVARRSLATIGVDWRDPPVTWLYRHRWAANTRCPRPACGTVLRREAVAGRTACWCPTCQPEPTGIMARSALVVGGGRRRQAPFASVAPSSSAPSGFLGSDAFQSEASDSSDFLVRADQKSAE